jgi:glucan biosynthesis protein C
VDDLGRESQRIEQIDAARACLMLLGIVLHALNPYIDTVRWLVADAATVPVFTAFNDWIHAFRMPAFFLIAGFLSAATLSRVDPRAFVAKRARRLLLPFAFALLTINAAVYWLLRRFRDTTCAPDVACAVTLPAGTWVGHLWFLPILFIFTLALIPARAELRGNARMRSMLLATGTWITAHSVAALALLAVVVATVRALIAMIAWVYPGIYATHGGFALPGRDIVLALFFGVGALLWDSGIKMPARITCATLATLVLLGTFALVSAWQLRIDSTALDRAIASILESAAIVALTAFALLLSFRLCWRARAVLQFGARHAYPIYIVHQPVIVLLSLSLLGSALPAIWKFAIVLVGTSGICIGIALALQMGSRTLPAAIARWPALLTGAARAR